MKQDKAKGKEPAEASTSVLTGRPEMHQQYRDYFSQHNPELLQEAMAYHKLLTGEVKKNTDRFVLEVQQDLPVVVREAVESTVLKKAKTLKQELETAKASATGMTDMLAKQGTRTMVNQHNAQAMAANESVLKYNEARIAYEKYAAGSGTVKDLLGLDHSESGVQSSFPQPLPKIRSISENDVPAAVVRDLADALGAIQFNQMTTLPVSPETLAGNISTTVGKAIDGVLVGKVKVPEIQMTDNPLFCEDNSRFFEREPVAPPKINVPHEKNVRVLEPPKSESWSGSACLSMTIYTKPSSISGGNALLGLGLFFFCADRLVGWMAGRYHTTASTIE
jgi:hypothetical protein